MLLPSPVMSVRAEELLDISEYGPVQDMGKRNSSSETSAAVTETSAATSETNSTAETTAAETSASVTETSAGGSTSVGPVVSEGSGTGTSSASSASNTSEYTASSVNLSTLSADSNTKSIGDLIQSKYAAVFDLDQNRIVASKNADQVIYPASMTKIMTVLVCAERVGNLDEKLTVTQDIVDYINAHDASNCGFAAGEQVSVRDLLYGIILPSGADAVMTLTRHIAGSDEAFVALMNQKAQELGLSSNTHFSNATGLYDANHKTTVGDMAEILNAALKNPTAREVLSAHTYKTSATNKHSSGISFSNLFLRRIEDQELGGATVRMAKTGYVRQSMFCAASYGTSSSGKHYIVVSAYGPSTWQCIYDQAAMYKTYAK